MPAKLNMSVDGSGPVQSTRFLGQEIGFPCLAKLLGVGANRLRKGAKRTPDQRLGKERGGSKRETWSIDAFFTTMYTGIAETLPDRSPHPN